MERDGLSSADQKLIRESWQKVGTSPLEHGTVLFARKGSVARTDNYLQSK